MSGRRPVGRTKDAGWQIGVRRTVAAPVLEVWRFLTSVEGLALWLGKDVELGHRGATYETADGTTGEVRSRHEGERLRITMHRPGSDHATTVQMTARVAASGTTIGFHEERMKSADERVERRDHWRAVHEEIARALR